MDQLVQAALDIRANSYSPYSHFAVSAALETESGKIFTGVNVENASYGLSICAERTALVKAVSEGHQKFKRLVVVTELDPPGSPCGMCRQMLNEFNPTLELWLVNPQGKIEKTSLDILLPRAFRLER